MLWLKLILLSLPVVISSTCDRLYHNCTALGPFTHTFTSKYLIAEEKSLEMEHAEFAAISHRLYQRFEQAKLKNDTSLEPSEDESRKCVEYHEALQLKTSSFHERFDQWLGNDISKWSCANEHLEFHFAANVMEVGESQVQLQAEDKMLKTETAAVKAKMEELIRRLKKAELKNDSSFSPTSFEIAIAEAQYDALEKKRASFDERFQRWRQEDIARCSAASHRLWEYEVRGLEGPVMIHRDDSYVLLSSPKDPPLIGGVVWDPAKEVAQYLGKTCAENDWIRGKKVLDLSAGTGYVGIVAACFGGDVTLTDLPQMLPLMQLNIDENAKMIEEAGGKVSAHTLRWGDEDHVKNLPKQDVIILSEIIYNYQSLEPLISSVLALSKEGTELIVCQYKYENKEQDELWDNFYQQISQHFNLSSIPPEDCILHRHGVLQYLRGSYLAF